MKVLVVVQVWRKACNTGIDKEIGGFKGALGSPNCWKSAVVCYFLDHSCKHLSFFLTLDIPEHELI
jgi:hypothetical protein